MKKNILFKAMRLILMLSFIVIFISNCKKDEIKPSDDDIIISEFTKVISESSWETEIISFDESSNIMVISNSLSTELNLEEGDILISSYEEGYLKKIKSISISDNKTTLSLEDAVLTDAVEQGNVVFSNTLTEEKSIPEIMQIHDGVNINFYQDNYTKATSNSLELDVVLYDADGNPDTENDQVTLNGNFEMTTDFSGELDIKGKQINKINVEYNVSESLEIKGKTTLISLDLEKEKTLAKIGMGRIIVMMGTVPIVIKPELEIKAGFKASINSDLSTSISQDFSYTAGLTYENSSWSTYSEIEKSFDFTPPTLSANLDAKFYIKPELSFKIYGTIAPKLYADLYAKLHASTNEDPWWLLSTGLNIGGGVTFKILNREVLDYEVSFFNFEIPLASSDGANSEDIPVVDFISDLTTINEGATILFSDLTTNNPNEWYWDFGDGSSSTDQNPSHTYSSEGTYTVTLTATNNYGSSNIEKVDLITVRSNTLSYRSLILNSATINDETQANSSPVFYCSPNSSIIGTFNVLFETNVASSNVFPLSCTPNWGDKENDHWQEAGDMSHGSSYNGSISLTAPSSNGTYYILISTYSEYNAAQVVSATHWSASSIIWDDGNDLYDLSENQIENGLNTGSIIHPLSNGEIFSDQSYGLAAIKIIVQ